MQSFGEIIKEYRKKQQWVLRKAAALVDIDQAIISKIERGERIPSKAQVLKFSSVYHLDKNLLLISWYSDKIAYDLMEEENISDILKAAESKVKYLKSHHHE